MAHEILLHINDNANDIVNITIIGPAYYASIILSILGTICVCSCKHHSSWVASYIHAWTNKTHSIADLQDLIPTLALVVCVAYNYCCQSRD